MMYDKPLERAVQYRTMAAEFRQAFQRCSNDVVKSRYRLLATSYEQLAYSVEHLYQVEADPKDH